jgi:Xaa-Pro aminopeptidase
MKVFKKRRQELLKKLGNGIAVIPSAAECRRGYDSTHPFRQDASFYYLTGFNEPGAILVLDPNEENCKEILFLRPNDPAHELWNGPRVGVVNAPAELGIDVAWPLQEFLPKMVGFLSGRQTLWIDYFAHTQLTNKLIRAARSSMKSRSSAKLTTIGNLQEVIGAMRLVKDDSEIIALKKAAAVNSMAHKLAMQFTKPGRHEYEIQSLVEYIFRKEGMTPAFESIIAAGNNATCLHYTLNKAVIRDNDLVLVDIGPEIDCMASDVTRTFPASGKFTSAQRDLYEIVLTAHDAAIESIALGKHLGELQEITTLKLTEGLLDLKILKGSVAENIETGLIKKFYPHNVSHWLGLDVHDNSPYIEEENSPVMLRQGFCFTIEPGLYIPASATDVPAIFKGIGIRLEDDILMTKTGYEILTADIPIRPDDVEALASQKFDIDLPS